MPRIEADRVVGRSEDHALHTLASGGLEQVAAADDIGLQDGLPGALHGEPAEVDDTFNALDRLLHLVQVSKVCCNKALVGLQVGRYLDVAQPEVRVGRRKQFAQTSTDIS